MRRSTKGILSIRRIEEIAFEIQYAGCLDHLAIEIVHGEINARAKICVHGALSIRRYENQTMSCRRSIDRGRRRIQHPHRSDVMTERISEFVISNFSDVTHLGSQRRKTGNGIACRAARKLHARTHQFTKLLRPFSIYQGHRGFRHLKPSNRRVICGSDDVNDGVADTGYVKLSPAHDSLHSVDVASMTSWRKMNLSSSPFFRRRQM